MLTALNVYVVHSVASVNVKKKRNQPPSGRYKYLWWEVSQWKAVFENEKE